MDKGLRSRFLRWLCFRVGCCGAVKKRWVVAVALMLFPGRIKGYLCSDYDPCWDVYVIEWLRLSGHFLRMIKKGHYRKDWHRIVDVDSSGLITIEVRIDWNDYEKTVCTP